ncbi:alanine racemase [Salipaludibacillus daqingensis]|uniref:alanine racemase n=1 Tax=Salipaludibacillus daqingensis TaxID=3041001 RepID=UPI0024751A60|nr:alanine racemase [Salipaludibacillus daqingensis]
MMIESISTPAIVIDEKKMKNNIKRMISVKDKNGVQVRPHFKTHKSSYIAHAQIDAGACGLTVAKVSEAELLIKKGIKDILIANPLIDQEKVQLLSPYRRDVRIIFTVDSKEQAKQMITSLIDDDEFEVWIKINSGLNRCGVEPGEEALELAKYVASLKGLKLTGLFTHAGHSYASKTEEQLNQVAMQEVTSIVDTASLCENNGIPITHRSVGSTPTFERAATYEGVTEVRPGNAVFFDRMQMNLGIAKREEVVLTVLTQLISKQKNRLVFDGGSKAFTTEKGAHGNEGVSGFGEAQKDSALILSRLSEEHGIIDLVEENLSLLDKIELGEKRNFIPNHACTAVNLFDQYHMLRTDGKVVQVSIDGRGKSQ